MNRRSDFRILMLLQNESYPDDTRVELEGRSLREAGYQVIVICPTGISSKFYENVAGVHVYRYPKPWELCGFVGYVWEYAYSLAMAFTVSLYVLCRRRFDVVHMHAPPDLYVLITGFYKLLGKRYVLDMHDLSPELYQARQGGHGNRAVVAVLGWFERLACRTADRLIATNQTQRRVQIQRGGAMPDRCHVVRNGPDARFLEPHQPIARLRHGDRLLVGYVGIIGVQDGVDYLLRALDCLRKDFKRRDFLAVIVGSGPALDDLKRLAVDLNLQEVVEFAGYRSGDDLLRHLASFDICVTPDPSNPYNDSCTTIKTMEYMAMGKPVVAFDLPENRVSAGDAALYASRNNERELAQLIARLMDQPEERALLGERGRQRVIKHWRWEIQQDNLMEVYDGLLRLDGASKPRDVARVDAAAVCVSQPPRAAAHITTSVQS
jgi:glycosyltransferase involved in cell wall biosynthesis